MTDSTLPDGGRPNPGQDLAHINRLSIALFTALVVIAAAYILLTCLLVDTPAGVYGQPRSSHLTAEWTVPLWVTIILTMSVIVAGTSVRWPLVGVCVYLILTHLFPVHRPYWIYTQWICVRTVVAALTFFGWYLRARRDGQRIQIDLPTKIFAVLVVWYAVTFAIAAVRYGNWSPPLQYHPRQLLDAFLLYVVVRHADDRERAFAIFGITMAVLIVVRLLVFQTDWYRDADVAMLLTLSIPIVLFISVWLDRWWAWFPCGALAFAGIYALYLNQNRGSAVAVLMSVTAWWATSRRRWWLICGLIPVLLVGTLWFSTTDFGGRFDELGQWRETLKTNQRVITWRAGLVMAQDYPVFGVRPGFFLTRVAEYEPRVKNHSAHNIIVDVLAESGILGLLLYLSFFAVSASLLWRDATTDNSAIARWALIMLAAFLGTGFFISWTMLWLGFLPTAMVRMNSEL